MAEIYEFIKPLVMLLAVVICFALIMKVKDWM